MIRRLYDWTLDLAERRAAKWWLAFIAFIESSVFPIPPDILVIPMVLAAREKAWQIATICTAASVAGGVAGYALGFFAFDLVGQPLLDFYGYGDKYIEFQGHFDEWGFWAVAIFGTTFLPFKVITVASGVMQMNLAGFIIASIIGRAIRFYLVAGLLWKFGEPIKNFIEKYLEWLSFAAVVLLVGGFLLIRYI